MFACLLATSCASFNLAKPISPSTGWPHKFVEVDSLQPVITWDQKFEGNADFILFEGPYTEDNHIFFGRQSEHGNVVYVEKNISGGRHHIIQLLKPNRAYFWAVRASTEAEIESEWSNYNYFSFSASSNFRDELFRFKTPSQ